MAAVLPLPDERDRPNKLRPVSNKPEDVLTVGNDLDLEVTENADGTATVTLPEKKKPEKGEFDQNLAELLDDAELSKLATRLMERIELDKQSRADRDKQYAEGLRRTGLGDDAPGGAQFSGASRAVHPMLAEAAVDFGASAMRELFPPSGPVRTKITGEQTPEQLKVAERQYKYMNWQLTEQMEEYPDELQQTLTQVPMGGSQYMKFWPDERLGRPGCRFVPVDDLLLPYGVNSFWASHRITHVQRLTEHEFEELVENGVYRDVEVNDASAITPETTKAGEASEKIEGVSQPMQNIDGLRIVYETNTFEKISVDGDEDLPYLISICETTLKVASIYRNWEEEDKRQERLHWIVDFSFIPWRGAIKLGLPQLIGGLAAAATGALRALLDSALVNTIPVLAKLKAAKMGGQAKTMDPMTAIDIEAGTGVDDIRKALMPIPFNQPSPVLYQMLQWITGAAKAVVTTASEKIAEASPQMPMGTALALIEQDAKLFSSIHAGLHRSQAKALKIIARINKDFLNEEEQVQIFGEIICTRDDFRRPLGVIPVSDPNIFSEGQRFAQMHLVQQTAATYPQLHNLYEMVRTSYVLAKIPEPDIDRILPKPKEPTELNAAAENSSVMLGQPIMAFPDQEHFAHLEAHMRFVSDPLLGGSPAAIPGTWPKMMEHIKQHLAFLYAKEMHDLVTQTTGEDLGEVVKDKKRWQEADQLIAAASKLVHAKLAEILQPLGPVLQVMLQQIAAMKSPQPMDPSAAALQVAQIEDKRKREETGGKLALEKDKLDEKNATDLAAAAARAEELRIKDKQVDLTAGVSADQASLDATRLEHEQVRAQAEHQRASDEHAAGLDQQEAERVAGLAQADASTMAAGGEAHAARTHEADQAQASRAHEAQQADATRLHTSIESHVDRTHQAGQSDADRLHQSTQSDADRQHQSAESEAQRKADDKRAAAERKAAAAAADKKPKDKK